MRKYILLLLILLSPLLLSSCAGFQGKPRMVVMKNPKTLDFKNCEVSFWGMDHHFKENDECVKRLKKQGYVVWGTD